MRPAIALAASRRRLAKMTGVFSLLLPQFILRLRCAAHRSLGKGGQHAPIQRW
jgi:hypothetical protein